MMSITLEDPPISIARWTENEEWKLIGMEGFVKAVYYSNPNHNYDSVAFVLRLKRKTQFYIL